MRLLTGLALACTGLLVAGSALAQCGTGQALAPGDVCPGPNLGTDPTAVIESTTVGLTNDYESGTCTPYGTGAGDGAYQVTVSNQCTISITYDECPDLGPNTDAFDRALYFVSDCNNPGGSCLCGADNTSPQILIFGPEFCAWNNSTGNPVTGFIIVDGFTTVGIPGEPAAEGQFVLEVGTACPPPPTGACCQSTTCSQETEADCNTLGGLYIGDGVACTPSPCPVPAEQTSWGKIKSMYND